MISRTSLRLQRSHPRIRLNIREGQGGELDTLLDSGSVDMAILFRYDKPRGDGETLLATANTYLVSGPQGVLTRAETVDFYVKRLGFRLTDDGPSMRFMRCKGSSDHHSLLFQREATHLLNQGQPMLLVDFIPHPSSKQTCQVCL